MVAVIVCVTLMVAAGTSRARLNVMQASAVLVFLLAAFRCWMPWRKSTPAESPQQSVLARLGPALIVGTLVWAPMLPFYFISEDFEHLTAAREPMIPSLVELSTRGQFGAFLRPVGFLSIFIDYRLFGESPVGYHVTNLAIHLLTAAGLYYLCVYAEAPRELAGCAALIYAVLPVHVETVAWMGARFDLLSACLGTWALALYMRFRRHGKWGAFVACLLLVCLAVLSKENAFVIPLLIIAAEWLLAPARRFGPPLAVLAVTATVFAYRWLVLGGIGGYAPTGRPIVFDFGLKTLEGLLIRGPSLMLLGYNWHQPAGFAFLFAVGLTAALLLVSAWHGEPGRNGRARLLFGFVWAVCAIAPTHSFLFINASMANSRILYFGSVGMALFVSQVIHGIRVPRVRETAMIFLPALLAIGALHNLTAWRWTSQLTKNTLAELRALDPKPRAGTHYVFHDLPDTVRGVYFLRSGFADAIRFTFGRDDVSGDRAGTPPAAETPVVHIQWKAESPPRLERIGSRSD
jgi:hypothetical protein